jgi:hypothetical protein
VNRTPPGEQPRNFLIEYVADLNKIIPFPELESSCCEFKDNKRWLYGVRVTYTRQATADDTQKAFNLIKNKKLAICGKPVEVEADFSGTFSLHIELFQHFWLLIRKIER